MYRAGGGEYTGKCFIGDNEMDLYMWTFVDTTLGIGHTFLFNNPFKSDTFYILLFGYQNGVEVIYVD